MAEQAIHCYVCGAYVYTEHYQDFFVPTWSMTVCDACARTGRISRVNTMDIFALPSIGERVRIVRGNMDTLCYLWTGARSKNRPVIWIHGKQFHVRNLLMEDTYIRHKHVVLPICEHYSDCVNPLHLEVLTYKQAHAKYRWCARKPDGSGPGAPQRRKTQCPRGHPYDAANTYIAPSSPTQRRCRTCIRLRKDMRKGKQACHAID